MLPQTIRMYTKHLLQASGRSVNDFAKTIKISQSTLSVFLNDMDNQRDVSSVTLEKIAGGFGKDAGTFLVEALAFMEKKTPSNISRQGLMKPSMTCSLSNNG